MTAIRISYWNKGLVSLIKIWLYQSSDFFLSRYHLLSIAFQINSAWRIMVKNSVPLLQLLSTCITFFRSHFHTNYSFDLSVRIDVIRATRVKYTAASGELCFDGYKDSCEVKYCQTKCTTYACQKSNCFLDCIPGQTKIGKKCMSKSAELFFSELDVTLYHHGQLKYC